MTRARPTAVAQEDVLRALWREHAGPLLGYALRATGGDRGRAEDVVQETLLRAWQHPEVANLPSETVRPWLLTVARRILIDQHRAQRSRPAPAARDAQVDPAEDDGIDAALDRWLMADALASLSPAHREALLHTYYAGRTIAEAAVVLGVPPGTVKSRVFYALKALKLALEERGVSS